MSGMTCDVCQAEESVGVAASPMGPVSLAYGKNCLSEYAEAKGIIMASFGVMNFKELKDMSDQGFIAEWVLDGIKVYHERGYITVRDWLSLDEDT